MKKVVFRGRGLLGLSLLLALGLAAGCACPAKVSYQPVQVPDRSGAIKFYLTKTLLLLTASKKQEGAENKPQSVLAMQPVDPKEARLIPVPAEYTAQLLEVRPVNTLGCTTKLEVSYLDNTRIIRSIGSHVKDQRKEMIAAAGGILGGLIKLGVPIPLLKTPVVARGVEEDKKFSLNLPVVLDPESVPVNQWITLPKNPDWSMRMTWGPLPPDSLCASEFYCAGSDSSNGQCKGLASCQPGEKRVVSVLPFSACRSLTLTLVFKALSSVEGMNEKAISGLPSMIFKTKAADPRWVQTMTLPTDGEVKMHSVCGADLTDKASGAVNWEAISELTSQVLAIQEAQEAAQKGK